MKKRNLVIGLLVMLAVIVSGFTFAFWASLDLTETESTSITIGSGRTITTEVDFTNVTTPLVPVGQINNSNEAGAVSEIELNYALTYTDTAAYATTTTFTVELTGITLNGLTAERIDFLFDIVVTIDGVDFDVTYDAVNEVWVNTANGSITKDVLENVLITVTFVNQPVDSTEYGIVATKALAFNVVFTTAQVLNS